MNELIKELLKDGYDVTVVEIKGLKTTRFESPKMDMPEPDDFKITGVKVGKMGRIVTNKNIKKIFKNAKKALKDEKPKAKRINWKTINKIKEAKNDGLSSAECAKELGLPLKTVNKHWV